MNVLVDIGLLLIPGYVAGWMHNKMDSPKIAGNILVGVALSPNMNELIVLIIK